MPKEVLKDPSDQWNVVVKWHRDSGDVQVGLQSTDGRSIVDHLYADSDELHGQKLMDLLVAQTYMQPADFRDSDSQSRYLKELGRLSRLALNQMPGSPGDVGGYSSIWSTPNRYFVNQLIVFARRARNAVYGKDE